MKNIKFGLIALAAVIAGTGSAYAVSASTETTQAISISATPLSLEDAAKLTKVSHPAGTSNVPRCPRCRTYFRIGSRLHGHCKANGKVFNCWSRTPGT